MPAGGKRKGAGRKPLAKRRTKKHVETASEKIDKMQPRAAEVLCEALDATIERNRIVGRDDNGNPEYEYYEVPDHNIRVRAAGMLLAKRIPDMQRTEHTGKDGEELTFRFEDYCIGTSRKTTTKAK